MLAQGAGDLLDGLDAGAHGLLIPFVKELVCPGGRVVFPELLEGFLEKVSAAGLQVVVRCEFAAHSFQRSSEVIATRRRSQVADSIAAFRDRPSRHGDRAVEVLQRVLGGVPGLST